MQPPSAASSYLRPCPVATHACCSNAPCLPPTSASWPTASSQAQTGRDAQHWHTAALHLGPGSWHTLSPPCALQATPSHHPTTAAADQRALPPYGRCPGHLYQPAMNPMGDLLCSAPQRPAAPSTIDVRASMAATGPTSQSRKDRTTGKTCPPQRQTQHHQQFNTCSLPRCHRT